MTNLKLGSLFDGISAFPLSAQRNGIEPIWASEIEPFPIQVSKRRFPSMKHLGSITEICLCVYVTHFKGTQCHMYINNSQDVKVEPVDIITFGSPCQDLSVAGKRDGLDGERSGLFFEGPRIIDEMREVTNGEYPTFAIWENVPGAFSGNSGEDFACVISSLVGAEVRCPPEGWTSAGVAFGPKSQVAWRVLDAQYWGVPQRRRRIFLVADFRGERAGEILFVEQGLRGDSQEGRKAGEEVARSTGDGVKTTVYEWEPGDRIGGWVERDDRIFAFQSDKRRSTAQEHIYHKPGGKADSLTQQKQHVITQIVVHPEVAGTLCASGAGMSRPAGMASETDLIVAFTTPTYAFSAGQSAKAGSIGFRKEIAPTLRAGESGTNQTPTIIEPIAFNGRQDPVSGKVTGALDMDRGTQCIAYPDPANTLLAKANLSFRGDQDNIVVHALDVRNLYETPELSGTLQAKNTGGYSLNYQNPVRIGYTVRRLIPLECERLMGFPDNWTAGGEVENAYFLVSKNCGEILWNTINVISKGAKDTQSQTLDYVSCTIKDSKGTELQISMKRKVPTEELPVKYAIGQLSLMEQEDIVQDIINLGKGTAILCSQREILQIDMSEPNKTLGIIRSQEKERRICKLLKICLDENLNQEKLFTISTWIKEILAKKTFMFAKTDESITHAIILWKNSQKSSSLEGSYILKMASITSGSDTARYKACGNSIAVPCLDFIFSQLVRVVRKYD